MKLGAFLPFVTFVLASCTHSVHIVHTDTVLDQASSKRRSQVVESEGEQFVVMGITDNTDYVNEAHESLQSQCVGGRVSSVLTRYSTSHGFFSWTNKVKMRGVCQR